MERAARLRRWVSGLALLASVGLGACDSPTLPLPPPETPSVSTVDANGEVTLKGVADYNAQVSAVDQRTGDGTITRADAQGGYTMVVPAAAGDVIAVWQVSSQGTSTDTYVTVPTPVTPLAAPTLSAIDASGDITITGTADPNAEVLATDEQTGVGTVSKAGADGSYSIVLDGVRSGDTLSIAEVHLDGTTGTAVTVQVP